MARVTTSSFAILYLRPEIATGYYDFPYATGAIETDSAAVETDKPADTIDAVSSTRPQFPGLTADDAIHLFPDGQIIPAVRERLRMSGFSVLEERVVHFSKPQLRRLYFSGLDPDSDEATRTAFLDRLTRGPTLALLLTLDGSADVGVDAVAALHEVIGPADPTIARQQALAGGLPVDQWPLRARCGVNEAFPGVDASVTIDCAIRERHQLFGAAIDPNPPLESAVVVLFPSFLAAVTDAKTQLLTAYNHHGVVVTSAFERSPLSTADAATIATADLDSSTDSAVQESLVTGLTTDGVTLVLRVVGFHLDVTLRELVGPTTLADAQRFFPQSLRSQLTSSFSVDDRTVPNATCLETGVFVSLDLSTIRSLAPEDERVTSTFAIIKPNAACDPTIVAAIVSALRRFGFSIERQMRTRLSTAQAGAFYAEHVGKPFFPRLMAYMTSGEIVALELSRKLAVSMWRALMGPTNCLVARATHPWTLRARFGIDGTQNATHGSDAAASARRELRFFFGSTAANAPVDKMLAAEAANNSMTNGETLEKVLVRGLDALLQRHERQEDGGPLDACKWLGEWLLAQSEHIQNAADNSNDLDRAYKVPTKSFGKKQQAKPHEPTQPQLPGDNHRVVAIVVDASVSAATKEQVKLHGTSSLSLRVSRGTLDALLCEEERTAGNLCVERKII